MSFASKKSPISLENMILNIIGKTEGYGNALRLAKITGTVVGTPQEALDPKALRNLMNKALVLSPDDNKAVLLVYENSGTVSQALKGNDKDSLGKVLNSLFITVEDAGGNRHVCVNLKVLNAPS